MGAPDADDIANALVRAAAATGESHLLLASAEIGLRGPLRCRWLALAALRRAFGHGACNVMAHRWCGTHDTPDKVLRQMRRARWWDKAAMHAIAENLVDAHRQGGAA